MASNNKFIQGTLVLGMIFFLMMSTWFGSYLFKGYRRRRNALRLQGEESGLHTTYGAANEKVSIQYRD